MPELSRRRALTTAAALAAAATATGTAAAHSTHAAPSDSPNSPGAPGSFDEVYKGRRIQGRPAAGGGHHGGGHHGGGYAVFVDGVELHVMRNADGSWISVVSHYAPVPSPRAAARAAVDELQGARLLPFPTN
ncbi:tyrosinase cofactor [Streptomyces phaeoluteigriseus]|uniref:Tyrosinase cofactor n=1 Tax=Streptomyces phaeoluteigriseus TaxID=114686 RepID=A0ABY4Z7H9_9ACTN|nr:tyrosinase cofactor [Streptomyces phaeoluteigriseus]USQ84998.1 tyrosinase cofactor [Streptomyces phaeoluteigriseus]